MKGLLKHDQSPEFLTNIPPLPAVIRFYDDFSDAFGHVVDPTHSDRWSISFDGRSAELDFHSFDIQIQPLVKAWCATQLSRLSPVTAEYYFCRLREVPIDRIAGLLKSNPQEVKSIWKQCYASGITYAQLVSLKSLLSFLCIHCVGAWRPEWLDLTSSLPLPKVDKYASVRTGDVFLSFEEEAVIIGHIDGVCLNTALRHSAITDDILERTAILLCSYQFGFRAKQIAMLEMRNIRIWRDGIEDIPAVHLTFSMIKQRSSKRVFPMIRRVKREWAALFVELFERAKQKGIAGADHVFQRTPAEISTVVFGITESIGCRRGVVELRHTAALRLVDAGASEEELAAFMGHTDLNTGLVYFNSSRSQAERINQALGISSTYQNVMKIAHSRFISSDELAGLKGDQQIAGVPHGIPIGGCDLGQPSCPNNPVMSCYGCSRFMPIASARIHLQVLEDLREVMKFFHASSYAERGSPALQLESTIAKVQAVIDELGGARNELVS
jgi:integrase